MAARKPPTSAEARLARWARSMIPGTINGRVASATPVHVNLASRIRSAPPGGGFDPTADPVVIGLAATALGPDAVSIGHQALASGSSTGVEAGFAAGRRASATGDGATALGPQSQANGDHSTIVGYAAGTDGTILDATGIGYLAAVRRDGGTAIGASSEAGAALLGGGTDATALGIRTKVHHDHSTAVGADATTTTSNQVMLGTSADFVEIPGNGAANGLVLTDTVSGTRYIVQVTSNALVLNAAP